MKDSPMAASHSSTLFIAYAVDPALLVQQLKRTDVQRGRCPDSRQQRKLCLLPYPLEIPFTRVILLCPSWMPKECSRGRRNAT